MLEINANTLFALKENIMIQTIPELKHYYVFNTQNGDHFKLNCTAHWVLDKIANGISFANLLTELVQNQHKQLK